MKTKKYTKKIYQKISNEKLNLNLSLHKNKLNKSENEMIIKNKSNKSLNINQFNNINYINNNITINKNSKCEYIENIIEKNNTNNNFNNSINYNNRTLNKKTKSSKSSLNEENFIQKSSKNMPLINSINIHSIEPFKIIEPHKIYKYNHTYKPTKFLFPFYYYFCDVIFDNLVNPKKFLNFSRKYFTIYNFMCQVYDISSHVVLIKQFNILKSILKEKFENDEIFIAKLYNKININNNRVIESLGDEFKHNKSLNFNYISE